MTDYCLSAADQATMIAGFQAVGIADTEGHIRTQGLMADGTEWAMLDVGARFFPSGKVLSGTMGDQPEMVSDGRYWVILRWNGDAPTPPLPAGITIAWASDDEEAGDYPAGLPRFA
jgi:hypothetical protein